MDHPRSNEIDSTSEDTDKDLAEPVNFSWHDDRARAWIAKLGIISVGELSDGGKVCAICLEDHVDRDKPVQMGCCNRVFHFECLRVWLSGPLAKTCPNCRAELSDEDNEDEDNDSIYEMDDWLTHAEGEWQEWRWDTRSEARVRGSDDEEGDWDPEGGYLEDRAQNTDGQEASETIKHVDGVEVTEVRLPDLSDEDIMKKLHNPRTPMVTSFGSAKSRGALGSAHQYRDLRRSGAQLPPIHGDNDEPRHHHVVATLSHRQDLAMFREFQRRGCFALEGMREEFQEERKWSDWQTYEYLSSEATFWCSEQGR